MDMLALQRVPAVSKLLKTHFNGKAKTFLTRHPHLYELDTRREVMMVRLKKRRQGRGRAAKDAVGLVCDDDLVDGSQDDGDGDGDDWDDGTLWPVDDEDTEDWLEAMGEDFEGDEEEEQGAGGDGGGLLAEEDSDGSEGVEEDEDEDEDEEADDSLSSDEFEGDVDDHGDEDDLQYEYGVATLAPPPSDAVLDEEEQMEVAMVASRNLTSRQAAAMNGFSHLAGPSLQPLERALMLGEMSEARTLLSEIESDGVVGEANGSDRLSATAAALQSSFDSENDTNGYSLRFFAGIGGLRLDGKPPYVHRN
jgi:hypothetical protein